MTIQVNHLFCIVQEGIGMIAASILKRHNMHKIKDVIGGFNAIPSNSEIT